MEHAASPCALIGREPLGWLSDEASGLERELKPVTEDSCRICEERVTGVGLRQEIADAYVVMRLAELVAEQRIGAVVETAVAMFGGNVGCLALQKLAAALVGKLGPIGADPSAAELRRLWGKSDPD